MQAFDTNLTEDEAKLFVELAYPFDNNDVYGSINYLSKQIADKIGAAQVSIYKYDVDRMYSKVMEAGQEETPLDRKITDMINGKEVNLDEEQIGRLTGIKLGDFLIVARNSLELRDNDKEIESLKKVVGKILYNASTAIDYTGLKTRICYDRAIACYGMIPDEEPIIVISMDLFNLKGVNDAFDHCKGDSYIKGVARILARNFKDFGTVYRVGGDEFVILIEDDYEAIKEDLIARIGKSCRETSELDINIPEAILRLNYGIACTHSHNIEAGREEADKLLKENKSNMYVALGVDRRHAKLKNPNVSFIKPM